MRTIVISLVLITAVFASPCLAKRGRIDTAAVSKLSDCVVTGTITKVDEVKIDHLLRPTRVKVVTIQVKGKDSRNSFRCNDIVDSVDVFVSDGPSFGTEADGCTAPKATKETKLHKYYLSLKSDLAVPVQCDAWIDL